MRLALANLDDGQFWSADGWTHDFRAAQTFSATGPLFERAAQQQVKNAAAAMMDGHPQRPVGFIWLTEPAAIQASPAAGC